MFVSAQACFFLALIGHGCAQVSEFRVLCVQLSLSLLNRTDPRPSLTTHLELTVRAAEQTLFSMATFLLDMAREEWVQMAQK